MNDKRFEAVLAQLSFLVAEARRLRNLPLVLTLDSLVDRWLLDCVALCASEADLLLFGSTESVTVPPQQRFRLHCAALARSSGMKAAAVASSVLTTVEELVTTGREIIKQRIKPLEGSKLSEDGICCAVFTQHPWYSAGCGYVAFSWHKFAEEASCNAAITNGAIVTVARDQDGHYTVPLEDRQRLGVSSSAV